MEEKKLGLRRRRRKRDKIGSENGRKKKEKEKNRVKKKWKKIISNLTWFNHVGLRITCHHIMCL